jgi:hypothetical protein
MGRLRTLIPEPTGAGATLHRVHECAGARVSGERPRCERADAPSRTCGESLSPSLSRLYIHNCYEFHYRNRVAFKAFGRLPANLSLANRTNPDGDAH